MKQGRIRISKIIEGDAYHPRIDTHDEKENKIGI